MAEILYFYPGTAGSFAHPIGINALPACLADTTVPEVQIDYSCDIWTITPIAQPDSPLGIFDFSLAENFMPDSSFNVQFSPSNPSASPYTLEVINPGQQAQASLHVRTEVGNEFESVLTYIPSIIAAPESLNVGALPNHMSKDTVLFIENNDIVNPVTINAAQLEIDSQWNIIAPLLAFPLALAPLAKDTVHLRYTAWEMRNPKLITTRCS